MRRAIGARRPADGDRRSSLADVGPPLCLLTILTLPYLPYFTYLTGAVSYFWSQVGPLKKQHSEPPRLADASEAPRLRDSDLPDDGRRTADCDGRPATLPLARRSEEVGGSAIDGRHLAVGSRRWWFVMSPVARRYLLVCSAARYSCIVARLFVLARSTLGRGRRIK